MAEPVLPSRISSILLAKTLRNLDRGNPQNILSIHPQEGELLIVRVIEIAESLGYMVRDLRYRSGFFCGFTRDNDNRVRIIPGQHPSSTHDRLTVIVRTTGPLAGEWTFQIGDDGQFVVTHGGHHEPPMSNEVASELMRIAVTSALTRPEPPPTP